MRKPFLTPQEMGLTSTETAAIIKRLWEEEQRNHSSCPDCGASSGTKHTDGCDVARCTSCGGQRLFCNCPNGESSVWEGLWPGTKECYEAGLICYVTWMEMWMFDYNRLYVSRHLN